MISFPSGIFNKYNEAVTALYNCPSIADETRLITISKSECPNCLPGSISVYKPGGPIYFNIGICPYCGGKSYIETETTSIVYLRVYSDKRKWLKLGNLEIPDGSVQILAKMTDFSAIKQCDYLMFYPNSDLKYKLDSDPFPYGFNNQSFAAYCVKI